MKNLLLLAIAIPLFSLAANDTTVLQKAHSWYIAGSVTPGVGFRYLKLNHTNDPAPASLISMRNHYETPNVSVACGPRIGYFLTEFLSIEGGVDYYLHTYSSKSVLDNTGYDTTYNNAVARATHLYHYLKVPIGLSFHLGKKKLEGLIALGMDWDIRIANGMRTTLTKDGEVLYKYHGPETYPFNRFNISPFIAAGIQYRINKKLFIRVSPIARMQALKNIDTPITEHLWSVGINASVLFLMAAKR